MLTFQNSNSFPIDDLWMKDTSVSTLLVPAHLIPELIQKKSEHGKKLTGYLKYLLRIFKPLSLSGMLPQPRKIKTEFQDRDLNLQKVTFRPNNADWIELGELALAFGKSRCYIFTFLLELDLSGFSEALYQSALGQVVPTKKDLHLRVSLILKRPTQDFARSYHVRV